jgi:predicted nucleic acid-binding protein
LSTFVVDASVAIKWVVEEQGTDEALRLRRHRLLAPDLLVAECANALWKKVRRQELSEEEAGLAARLLARADIDYEPMLPLLEFATNLAIAIEHPAYDCVYLALAELRDCDFITADESLTRKTLPSSLTSKVVSLSTFGSV